MSTSKVGMSSELEAKYRFENDIVWNMLYQERQSRKDLLIALKDARDCLMHVLAGEYTQSDIDVIIPEVIDKINNFLKEIK